MQKKKTWELFGFCCESVAIINGETADIVQENKLGLHVNPSNIKAISKLFEECIDMDEHKKNKYTVNSDHLLQTTFNKDRIINEITNILIGKTCWISYKLSF